MPVKDPLGDRCKRFESAETSKLAMVGIPLLARLDGKAFHTFTRGLERPYDKGMQRAMIETTGYLVQETHALVGYTQSDEITLLWHLEPGSKSQFLFDGRFQKIVSVLASMASARFNKLLPQHLPNKAHLTPCFDCRVWQVPSKQDAVEVFVWREQDAVRNSVTMAAQAVYSHKELHQKGDHDKHQMLHQKGINWNNYPAAFRRGQYVRKENYQRTLTHDELLRIRPENRPPEGSVFTRSRLVELSIPPLRQIGNAVDFLFNGSAALPRVFDDHSSEDHPVV